MAVFAYRAVTREGARARGVVDAVSEHAAWSTLRERGLYPTRLDTASAPGGVSSSVGAEQRAVVVRQVAVLLGGGVSLAEALAIVGDTAPRPLATALARVAQAVREGAPLADACRRDGVLLDVPECAVVAAGETSGTLTATLRDIAGELERRATRRRTLRRTLTYPAILLVVAGAVLVGTSLFVLPEIASLFADHPSALPLPTRLLLGVQALVLRGWWLGAVAAGGMAFAAWRWAGHPSVRRRFDDAVLAVPVVGPIVRDVDVARFAHAAARMLRAGLPLDVAVDAAAAAVSNRTLRADLLSVRRAIVEGRPLRTALADTRVSSPALLGLIGTGEETGGLADALREVGTMYDESADARIRTTFALLEPALIMSLALVVLALVWAVLVPFLTFDPVGPL